MSGPRDASPETSHARQAGFTLIQAVLVLGLAALAAGLLIPLASQLLGIERTARTEAQLRRLKAAMVGEREVRGRLDRTAFGYVGDFGRLPDSLPQLLRPLGQPTFDVRTDRRLGAGWQGPYLLPKTLNDTARIHRDAWGRPLR